MSDRAAKYWGEQLGLVTTPLFGRERRDQEERHSALLDGVRASFLMSDDDGADSVSEAADWAWSANVGHHLSLREKDLVISRPSGKRETFDRTSVESKLPEFLRYLVLSSESERTVNVIAHLIRLFRRHRATLRDTKNSTYLSDLDSFLYLLAIAPNSDRLEMHRSQPDAAQFGLNNFDPTSISDEYVLRFMEELGFSSATMRRTMTPLTIRHAGGALFQEAHAELSSEPVQMTLFGLADATGQRLDLASHGTYYTPPGLARTITEIAIEPHLDRKSIAINDPACGSGIFLCEAIRVLQRRRYTGRVMLTGSDISPHAVQMAKFSLACALLDWPSNKVEWSVQLGDFFETEDTPGKYDVVLMNPPFLAWESLSSSQRSFVKAALGETFAGRPDLSTAFIQNSLSHLSDGGTLATLVPRGVLDSQRGARWRQSILDGGDVRLVGTFGEHGLFRYAMVSIGAIVFEKTRKGSPTIMVWSAERSHSAESALRALRRRVANNFIESRAPNWAIYVIRPAELAARKSWLPSPNAIGVLLDTIKDRNFPVVGTVFRVRQSIKTGLNEAFLISDDELKALPARERKYFRRVVSGEDIYGGRIHSTMNMFYAPKVFTSKRQLLAALPVFGKRLATYESALKNRKSIADPSTWWEPVRPRSDLAEQSPRIFTKMFGGPNMAAVDLKGEFLPLQAYAWMPTFSADVPKGLEDAALYWYCRIINSRIFFLLRRDMSAAVTAGGQLDVSPKYVNDVPIPPPRLSDLELLATTSNPDVTSSRENDAIIATAYGTSIEAWPPYESNF
ncbi:MAG: HsdM family class I SAM-dependent methyltransferase [Methylovirgula sp.]